MTEHSVHCQCEECRAKRWLDRIAYGENVADLMEKVRVGVEKSLEPWRYVNGVKDAEEQRRRYGNRSENDS